MNERIGYFGRLLRDWKMFLFGIAAGLIVSIEIELFWGQPIESGTRFLNQTLAAQNAKPVNVAGQLFVLGLVVIGITVYGLALYARKLLQVKDWLPIGSIDHRKDIDGLSLTVTKMLDDFTLRTGLTPRRRQQTSCDEIMVSYSPSEIPVTKILVTASAIEVFAWRNERGLTYSGRILEFLNARLTKLEGDALQKQEGDDQRSLPDDHCRT